jgi:hypothetical protein
VKPEIHFHKLFPGGDRIALEGLASLYFFNMSNKAIKLDFCFIDNDSDGLIEGVLKITGESIVGSWSGPGRAIFLYKINTHHLQPFPSTL